MRTSVSSAIVPYNAPLEGMVLSMYADWESLITTSIGCLIDSSPMNDPWAPAVGLPWRKPDGSLATRDEVVAEWRRVKAGTCGLKRLLRRSDCPRARCFAHDGWRTSETPASLKLSRADAEALVVKRAAGMWAILVKRFPMLANAPADAQLGVLSWAWAMGPSRVGWPKFFAAIQGGDWATCAVQSQINTAGNAGVVPRNAHQRTLFMNAARVVAKGLDPDVLHWPHVLPL